jgi:hypothetical protein
MQLQLATDSNLSLLLFYQVNENFGFHDGRLVVMQASSLCIKAHSSYCFHQFHPWNLWEDTITSFYAHSFFNGDLDLMAYRIYLIWYECL